MKHTFISRAGAALVACAGAGGALAHDGHGLAGSHWHATDTLGLLLVGVMAGLALWLSARK